MTSILQLNSGARWDANVGPIEEIADRGQDDKGGFSGKGPARKGSVNGLHAPIVGAASEVGEQAEEPLLGVGHLDRPLLQPDRLHEQRQTAWSTPGPATTPALLADFLTCFPFCFARRVFWAAPIFALAANSFLLGAATFELFPEAVIACRAQRQ